MKPKFDISNKNGFTVWESGFLNTAKRIGSSIIVADSLCQPCKVIYDKNPTSNLNQFLFYANPGMLLASSFVRLNSDNTVSTQLELAEIKTMTTTTIQGELQPVGEIATLFLVLKSFDSIETAKSTHEDYKNVENFDGAKYNLLKLAVEKSFTERDQQRLFWGIPREREDSEKEFNSSVRYVNN
jgi:hypothetical protein